MPLPIAHRPATLAGMSALLEVSLDLFTIFVPAKNRSRRPRFWLAFAGGCALALAFGLWQSVG